MVNRRLNFSLALRFCVMGGLLVLSGFGCAQVPLPAAVNLQADGAQALKSGVPIVLFYSLDECHFCRGVLREVLNPMLKDKGWQAAAIYRQINVEHNTALIDFAGKASTHSRFAKAGGQKLAPTLLVVDETGKPLGDPLVGVANWDFYGYYVEELIRAAHLHMQARLVKTR
jgi:hypothetical protein